ncbi:MAG: SRPBCC domain-containing protein [Flavobacteriales bacterium]|nr:SRPBCC domain-containing protein [Flavobacteriales bacterium]
MNSILQFDFRVDKSNNTITVKREFAANKGLVWEAWTNPAILDQWWAPKPYRTETKSMDFREGGMWLYAMVSPTDEKHWCKNDYHTIDHGNSFTGLDAFCDEVGVINTSMPRTLWTNNFEDCGQSTVVHIHAQYNSLEDLELIISMGFKEGFTMALENLDQYIEMQFKLRSELGKGSSVRTTTYLNFPGNTEEAMNFYRSVFKSEFLGKGIQRFGDIPVDSEHPPVAESIKDMVLHVQLPILGNHLLMATDAPEEMGFKLTRGNNMHICLEPESREEARRLFDALSEGGTVTMPLEDMFFGAYFGEFSDKFGINWMINFQNE